MSTFVPNLPSLPTSSSYSPLDLRLDSEGDDELVGENGDVLVDETMVKEEKGQSLGVKSIDTFLSFVFVINQIYGPGKKAVERDCEREEKSGCGRKKDGWRSG